VLLGQYLELNAETVAEALKSAAIPFYTTHAGALTQTLFIGEWGVRFFVERASLDAARTVVDRVVDT